jgi:hypothetical protein
MPSSSDIVPFPEPTRGPLNTEPRYGYYPWWPVDGDNWVHPEDIERTRALIPSLRVWRRQGIRGPFVLLHYGPLRLRVRPTLWIEVSSEGLEVGDWVEVCSRMMRNTYRIARIGEMIWDERARSIRYQVHQRGQLLPAWLTRADLRPVEPISPPRSEPVIWPTDSQDEPPLPMEQPRE